MVEVYRADWIWSEREGIQTDRVLYVLCHCVRVNTSTLQPLSLPSGLTQLT